MSMVHVFQANIAVHPFPRELPWSSHVFYKDRCFREPRRKKSIGTGVDESSLGAKILYRDSV